MRIPSTLTRTALVVALAAPLAASAAPLALELDPAATRVGFVLPATGHDVHGDFHLRQGAITFEPQGGPASGDIVVDAGSGESGNGSRDRTMKEDVLEIAKFPAIVFHAERVDGALATNGPSTVTLHGTLDIHGTRHQVALPAKVEVKDGVLRGTTRVEVPFKAWGMHDPSMFILHVADVVGVEIALQGRLVENGTAAAQTGR